MKKLLLICGLLAASIPASAAISFIGECHANTTSCTPPAHQVGDLFIAYAGRNSSTVAPTVPSDFSAVRSASINGTSTADSVVQLSCKIATTTSETASGFTNADHLQVVIYRGVNPTNTASCGSDALGAFANFTSTVNTTTTTETFNAVTNQDSRSWDVGLGYCSACTAGIGTAPAGMQNRGSSGTGPAIGGHDTNAAVASFASANVTLTTAGRIITMVVEVKAPCTGLCHLSSGVGCSAAGSGTSGTNSFTFSCTPTNANDAILFEVECIPTSGTITAVSLTATGWTFTSLTGLITTGSTGLAVFGAIAPNTSSTTFTATWTGAGNCTTFTGHLHDEFSGNDTTGGTTTFYAHNSNVGTGCSGAAVTSNNAADAVWGGCSDSLAAASWAGSGWSGGVNDGVGDATEYKFASGSQTPTWSASSGGAVQFAVAVLKATAGGTACTNIINLMGVGCS